MPWSAPTTPTTLAATAAARIVVETTGLADPAPILQMTLNNSLASHFCVLEGVATTVDALHAERQMAEHQVSVKQVALADRLLVTKTDLAGHSLPALETLLRRANPLAPILVLPTPDTAACGPGAG